jgi:hypothetical protein
MVLQGYAGIRNRSGIRPSRFRVDADSKCGFVLSVAASGIPCCGAIAINAKTKTMWQQTTFDIVLYRFGIWHFNIRSKELYCIPELINGVQSCGICLVTTVLLN